MKTVICAKTGSNKSISLETRYNVISETDKRYVLINDKGIEAKYCKSLFIEVAEPRRRAQPAARPEPTPAPVVPPRVQFNELDIEVETTYDEDDEKFNFKIIATGSNNYRYEMDLELNETGSSISCGINQLIGLNDLLAGITDFKSNLFRSLRNLNNTDINITEDEVNTSDILSTILNDIIEYRQDNDRPVVGAYILSTNLNAAAVRNEYITVLDEISEATMETLNPNSGNRIKMWTLKTE